VRRWWLTLPATAAVLLLMAVLAPATWVDRALQDASQGTLGLGSPRGTLWQGGGELQAILPAGETVTLAPIAWTLSVAELLQGRLHYSVLSERDGKPVLDFTLQSGASAIHDARLDLPAPLLGAVSPTLREAGLGGRIAVRANGLSFDGRHGSGKAELIWSDAASSLTPVRPLGNYRLELTGQEGGVAFRLSTLDGVLALAGEGVWLPGQQVTFKGTANPAAEKLQDLAPLLRILGRETGPGSYQLLLDPNVKAL